VYTFRGREIPRAAVTGRPPIVPHAETTMPTPGGVTYTRRLYVTKDAANPSVRAVTVLVSWTPAAEGINNRIQAESIITGYQCSAQPGPRPCESHWYAKAEASDGSFNVSGSLINEPVAKLFVNLTGRTAEMESEQLGRATASGSLASASTEVAGVVQGSAGGQSASAAADDAISTATLGYHNPAPVGPSASSVLDVGGQDGSAEIALFRASLGAGSTAGAVGAANAAGQSALMGGGTSHVIDNDALPYARAAGTTGGAASASLLSTHAGTSLGLGTMLSVPATGSAGSATAERHPGASASTADDDKAVATATRTLTSGNVDLFSFPTGAVPPLLWEGYLVRLTGWSATAAAAAGPAATTGNRSASQSGTLRFWNGLGYTSVNLATGNVNAAVSASASVLGCGFSVSGQVQGGGTSLPAIEYQNDDTSKPIESAQASVNPPIAGTFAYEVTCLGITLVDVSITVDLGTTMAEAHYAVPDA
jgi:hypothetical protein